MEYKVFGDYVALKFDKYIKEEEMALQIKKEGIDVEMLQKVLHDLNYKPVVSSKTISKKTSNEDAGPVGETTIEHPGVYNKKNSGCSVSVSGGKTCNLGNYESARIDFSITIPCDPENIKQARDWGIKFVEDSIEEAVSGIDTQTKKNESPF